jgi:hypothetical protein
MRMAMGISRIKSQQKIIAPVRMGTIVIPLSSAMAGGEWSAVIWAAIS